MVAEALLSTGLSFGSLLEVAVSAGTICPVARARPRLLRSAEERALQGREKKRDRLRQRSEQTAGLPAAYKVLRLVLSGMEWPLRGVGFHILGTPKNHFPAVRYAAFVR